MLMGLLEIRKLSLKLEYLNEKDKKKITRRISVSEEFYR
jgi:hypothetical protein